MGTEGFELHGRVATLGSVHEISEISVLLYLDLSTGMGTEGFELFGRVATIGSVH